MSMEIPPGDWVQHESERLEQIWEQNFHPAVSKAVCCKMLRKTSGGCHQQCFCIQHTVKGPLFSTALDPCPAVPPRRASSQPQHTQCSTQSGLAPWRFALQPIALGGMESTGTALNVHYKQKKPNSQGISQAKSSLHFTMPYRLGCFEVLGVGQNFAPINVRSMRFTPHFSGTLIYIMASVFLKMPPISLDSLFFYLVITFQLRKTKLVEIQE